MSPPECHTQLDKHTTRFKYLRILVTAHFIIGLTVENACPCKEVMPNDRIRSRCIFIPGCRHRGKVHCSLHCLCLVFCRSAGSATCPPPSGHGALQGKPKDDSNGSLEESGSCHPSLNWHWAPFSILQPDSDIFLFNAHLQNLM